MKSLGSAALVAAAIGFSSAAPSSTPYVCIPEANMTYQQDVALQTAMVNKMARLHPNGMDVAAVGVEPGMAGTDTVNAGFMAAAGVMHVKGQPAKMTAGSVQSALGMILSGCAGQGTGGQVMIDNVVYGLY